MKNIFTILMAVLLLFTFSQVGQSVQAKQEEYQLNLSHIKCMGTYVEIHFVLLNTNEDDIISDLTYTYGTIPPGARTGNVVHFTDNVPFGYYNITSASVWVNGTEVTLHNPGAYSGYYGCQQQPTNTPTNPPTNTPTTAPTNTPTTVPTNTPTTVPTNTPTSAPTNTPTTVPTNTPTNAPTNTPTNTPTAVTVTPTDPPKLTPTTTETPTETPTSIPTTPQTPTETPTITPDPSTTATPTDPTATVSPTTAIVTATFSVPNTGRDNNYFGPGFIIAGLITLGVGFSIIKFLRKPYTTKGK